MSLIALERFEVDGMIPVYANQWDVLDYIDQIGFMGIHLLTTKEVGVKTPINYCDTENKQRMTQCVNKYLQTKLECNFPWLHNQKIPGTMYGIGPNEDGSPRRGCPPQ